jgi:hypothetical protein
MHRTPLASLGGRLAGTVVAATLVLATVAGPASAASAPTATTGPLSAIAPTTATVTGAVNPNGEPTTWYVEYGQSTSYGSRTGGVSAGSGTSASTVSAQLGGLTAGTTYHYRVVAGNASGTTRGADGIFTTSATPAADTGAATDLAATSATLNGTVDPNGRATTWYFEYGTSTGYGTRTPAQSAGAGPDPVPVSAPISNLRPGRLYHFRVVATSDAGTDRGPDKTFTVGSAPAVTTDAATSVTPATARLNGTINPNGEATTWYFEYGTSTGYGSRTPVRSAGSGTRSRSVSASVARLATNATYHFRLVAVNASGTTTGADQTFSTSFAPLTQTGPAQGIGATAATLTGSVDPRGRTTSWYFEYGTTSGYGSRTQTTSAGSRSGAQSVTAPIANLAPSTTYHFRLVATSDAGTGQGADVAFTTAGPPVTLASAGARVVFGRTVTLSGAVASKQANERVTVLAQRVTDGDGSFTPVATVLTGNGGTWAFLAAPTIRTAYQASWGGYTTPEVMVAVRPAITFRVRPHGRFSTHVGPTGPFFGRFVQLQRLTSNGRWLTVKRARLNQSSSAVFHPRLPQGSSRLRIAMSVNQAGTGYLGGFSRTITYGG